jgi:hypothetical protein
MGLICKRMTAGDRGVCAAIGYAQRQIAGCCCAALFLYSNVNAVKSLQVLASPIDAFIHRLSSLIFTV